MKPEKRQLFSLWCGLCAFIVGIVGFISLCEVIFYTLEKETPFLKLSIPYYYVPIQSQLQIYQLLGAIPTIVIIMLIFTPWSMKLFNRARLYSIRSSQLALSKIPLDFRYVLYLRSFSADTSKIIKFTSQTEEEILVDSLSPIGKTVAIGCPRDKIPPLGGYRFYVKDEEWQNTVLQLSENAELTALRVGETEGLSWEINTLINIPDLQKLIFLIPDIEKINLSFFGNLENAIRKREANDVQITPCYFNKQGWGTVSSIIYFEKQKNGSADAPTYIMKQSLVPRRTIWNRFGNLSPAFHKAMFPVYEQFGILNFKKKFYNALSTYLFYILAVIVIICSVVMNLNKAPKQSITAVLQIQAIHEAEQIYPELANIMAAQTQESKRGRIYSHGHIGSVYLSDEHLNDFISLDLQVSERIHCDKLSFDEAVAKLPPKDAIRFNNFLLNSALMDYQIKKPEYKAIYTPEEFNKYLSEARSSLTEEQYETINKLLSPGNGDSLSPFTLNQSYIDYLKAIDKIPDKSIKAFLFRGYFFMNYLGL